MFGDKINVVELFHAKSPSLAGCKEGDLPLWTFPTWHVWKYLGPVKYIWIFYQ